MAVRRSSGFTLPEVLIALAIVVIAFLAMYGSAQQIVFATTLQQEKTFATWVAQNQLTELRLLANLPDGDRIADSTEMAGLEWRYVIEFEESPVATLLLANISVSLADSPDVIITRMQAAIPVTNPTAPGSGAGNSGNLLIASSMWLGGGGGSDPNGDDDGDGIPNAQDPDDDNDGIPDAEETGFGAGLPDPTVIDDATGNDN